MARKRKPVAQVDEQLFLDLEAKLKKEADAKKEESSSQAFQEEISSATKLSRLKELAAELAKRKIEALALYCPMFEQENFHNSPTHYRIVRGSNRCLAGDQLIYDPVQHKHLRVDQIESHFHVTATNPSTGDAEIAQASQPFVKAWDDLYEVQLESFEVIRVTLNHRVLDASGRWITIRQAYATNASLLERDEYPHTRTRYALDGLACTPTDILYDRRSCHHSGSRDGISCSAEASPLASLCRYETSSEFGNTAPSDPTTSATYLDRYQDEALLFASTHPLKIPLPESPGTTRIIRLKHIGRGLVWDFTVDGYANYHCGSLVNANSGKTLCAAAEVARAVTNQDPLKRYPEKDGICFIVGKDEKHLGSVIYKKLFQPGAFKIIRDDQTNRWRAYRPWEPLDLKRENESRPAPPLIPPRFVHNIAWKDKKLGIPAMVSLINGWEIHMYSSLGKPPQGSAIDIFWFDEEIVDPSWYPEMAARIVDRRGRGIWSATPQAGTDQLYELHERAQREAFLPRERRRIEEFVLLLAENKYMSLQAKKDIASDLSDEEAAVRVGGEYAINSYKVYPTFNTLIHGHPSFEIPTKWTKYAYIDPGHRTCAVLFVAVPPDEDMVLIYHELYLREINAEIFAQSMKQATTGHTIEAFVIDPHMSLSTEVGSGKTVMQQYSEALSRHQVRSRSTGSGFLFANSDVRSGILAVQGLLRVRDDGKPKLRIMDENCPNFLNEIKKYHRKKVGGIIRDEPDTRKDNHLMDTLRYMAMHDPKYVHVQKPTGKNACLDHFKKKLKMKRDRDGNDGVINLGPGGRLY